MERIVEFPTDRTVISTENNGFAGDERDETLIDENLVETEIPLADRIPGAVRETEEGDRPIYDEEGHRNDPGGGVKRSRRSPSLYCGRIDESRATCLRSNSP